MTVVRPVESFRIGSVKECELPREVEGLPFSADELGTLLEACPAVMTLPGADWHLDYLPFNGDLPESDAYLLSQPTREHKRSFQLTGSKYTQPWQDEFGNTYRAITTKGNNYSDPHILETMTASNGYIAYGLQESEVIERVLKASEVLRSRGISTEYLLGLAEPKKLPWPTIDSATDATEYIPLAEYKQRITADYWQSMDDDERAKMSYIDLFSKFEDMVYYVSLRASDSAYRLFDMRDPNVRGKIYEQVNTERPSEAPFVVDNHNDSERFLVECVAPNLGRNFAKLHIDLAHRFPHGSNITAFGGIVDLDSVHGEGLGLGDEPITMADRANDLTYILRELSTMVPVVPFPVESQLITHHTFIDQYLSDTFKEFGGDQAAVTHIGKLIVAFEESARQGDNRGTYSFVWTNLIDRMKSTYLNDFIEIESIETDGHNELVQATQQLLAHPNMATLARTRLREMMPVLSDDLVNEFINEINEAHMSGKVFDMTQFDEYTYSRQWSNELVPYFMDIVSRGLSEANVASKVQAIDDTQVRAMVYRELLEQYDEVFNDHSDDVVASLVDELTPELVEAMNYTFPKRVFGDNTTHTMHTGFKDKQFWYFGGGIDWDHLSDVIGLEQISVVNEQIRYDSHGNPIIQASSPDMTVTEVVADTFFGMFGPEKTDDGQPYIAPSFDTPPQYIAVVEYGQDGKKFVRVLRDEPVVETSDTNIIVPDNTDPAQYTLF